MRWIMACVLGLAGLWPAAGYGKQSDTAPEDTLVCWSHTQTLASADGPVPNDAVRVSPYYVVRVTPADHSVPPQRSCVYMSVPRRGCRVPPYSGEDGAEFAVEAGLSMSWSSFLYGSDVLVEIERTDRRPITSVGDVLIRPATLAFQIKQLSEYVVQIRVPYCREGLRFSVEFADDILTSYNDLSGISGRLSEDPSGRAIHAEPRHALMIFAEPLLSDSESEAFVPDESDGVIHYPSPGQIAGLHEVDADVIYFRPGIYWMPWNEHAQLADRTRWVYLAPGAYVKGAFEFAGAQDNYRVTGFGVLSGELYVYEADRSDQFGHVPYTHRSEDAADCHGSCVKMLQCYSTERPQKLTVHGITLSNPPYHSFVVYGDTERFTTDFLHFKQVGAWTWQTDGPEIYRGGCLAHSFLHANDDVIKLYHSEVSVTDCVIWKGENGPVIQWGWIPRELDTIHVNGLDIIHNRMYWKDVKSNSGLLNASGHWTGAQNTADPEQTIRNILIENVRSEGMNPAAMRFQALANWENIEIRNLWMEAWNGLDDESLQSRLQAGMAADGNRRVTIGNEMEEGRGLRLIHCRVGDQLITKDSEATGKLRFDADLKDHWNAR